MILVDIFDAAREGDWDAFQKFFNGNINQINQHSNYNLLQLVVTSTENPEDRLAILRFLLENGIDLDYRDKKFQRNALHIAFFGFRKGDLEYLKKQTELLISAGVDVNAVDKLGIKELVSMKNIHALPALLSFCSYHFSFWFLAPAHPI